MLETAVFRNAKNELGLLQKEDNTIIYFVDTHDWILNNHNRFEWDQWVENAYITNLKKEDKILTAQTVSKIIEESNNEINNEIIDFCIAKYPGSYYPRIARDRIRFDYVTKDFLQDMRAYQTIQLSLDELFNYIEPSDINLPAYGHKIRELLILACTEVEYLLLKTLTENEYPEKKVYTTKDFVKCLPILRLKEFEASLKQYPDLDSFKPFRNWDKANPTKSLAWYDAYNSVKHNRGENIYRANLENLLQATSAIHLLLEIQYGSGIFQFMHKRTDDRSIFDTTRRPIWNCDEVNCPILGGFYEMTYKWENKRSYFRDYPELI